MTDIAFSERIEAAAGLYCDGDPVEFGRQYDAELRFENGQKVGSPLTRLDLDLDLGKLGGTLTVELGTASLCRFARRIMHSGIEVGERLIVIAGGERVTVRELLDGATLLVAGPSGTRRVDTGDVSRPRSMAADQ